MKSLSRTALISLIKATTHDEIPKSVVDYWYMMYGKEISKEETE